MSEFETELARLQSEATRSRVTSRRMSMGLAFLSLLLAAVVAVAVWFASDNYRLAVANAEYGAAQKQEKKDLAVDAKEAFCDQGAPQTDAGAEACKKMEEEATKPADAPTVPPVPLPAVGEVVTASQIRSAVEDYCRLNRCQGADGRTPSPADVVRAVAEFCKDQACRGEPGTNGKDGQAGVAGQNAPPITLDQLASAVAAYCSTGVCIGPAGIDGQNATPEQISEAVTAYCSTGACVGPAGADGAAGNTGPQGEPGRGIRTSQCGEDGRWTITYTDGVTEDGGQCRTTIGPPLGGTL